MEIRALLRNIVFHTGRFQPRGSPIDTECDDSTERNYGRLRFCHGYSSRNCAFNS